MKTWPLVSLLAVLIAACAQAAPAPVPTATWAATALPTQSPTAALSAAVSATASATLIPTVTATPTPTPTPAPSLKQLTTGGCCVQPSWSADSRRVLFVDKPASADAAGLYAVDIATGASQPPYQAGPVALYSRDFSLITYLDQHKTTVESVSTGARWVIPNNGRSIAFSPDNQRVAWAEGDDNSYTPYDQRRSDLYIAKIDGTGAERVAQVYGGGFAGWLPDGKRILLSGRPSLAVRERTLSVYDLTAKSFTPLVTVERLSGVAVSNDGTWIAYYITFEADPSRNGLWIQRTDGSPARKLELWGGYQWRDDGHLLVIPPRASAGQAFEVTQVEAATGKILKLTDAAVTPLHILNGDWRVSPDGRQIVYLSSLDRNLWLMTLPAASQPGT